MCPMPLRNAFQVVLSGLMLVAPVAHAQTQPEPPPAADSAAPTEQANALFARAKQQQASGELAAACASFAESYQLSPRGGTLINLAVCHKQLGELVLARQQLLEARAVAQRDGRADREAIANEHLRALERELSWVDVAGATELGTSRARVAIDDRVVGVEANTVSVPLMPGAHKVRIEAEGFETLDLQLELQAGARARVPAEPLRATATVPEVPVIAAPAPSPAEALVSAPTTEAAAPAAATAPDAPQHTDADAYETWRTTGLAVAIAGIVGGLSAGAWALERKSVVQRHCDMSSRECDVQAGVDAASLGGTLALISTVACGVGLAGVGVWLFLPGGMLNERAPAATSSAGITWHGTF
jgi:hypothetical protein